MFHDDDEATIIVGTKRFYRHSNADAIEFASTLPEPVRWRVHLKGHSGVIDSEDFRAAKVNEERKR